MSTLSADPIGAAGAESADSAPTIGVEEEFVLVDPDTGTPFLGNTAVAAAAQTRGAELQLELSRCQIETATPVCTTLTDLRDQLRRTRAQVAAAATAVGAAVLATGVPPFGPPPTSITALPRYQRMTEHVGLLAEQVICGCHVHVGLADRDLAVQVSNHLRPWLPVLLALTANSAIAAGRDTGYASWRHVLWSRWPSAGPPPYFRSAQHYDTVVAAMLDHEVILDTAMLYWDVRLSAHLPTLEVRVSDVPATAEETVLLAALVRALVTTALGAVDRGQPAPVLDPAVLRAAYWRAARDGVTGYAVDTGSGHLVSAREVTARLVDHVRPALERTGDYRTVHCAVECVLGAGNGAVRQRRTLQAGTLADLLRVLTRPTPDAGASPEELGHGTADRS
ncbi:carboxylate-amine ligase [Rhodococcus koreensis]